MVRFDTALIENGTNKKFKEEYEKRLGQDVSRILFPPWRGWLFI